MEYNNDNWNNPFGSEKKRQIFEEMLNKGLIKRITLIEGHYPSNTDQKTFLRRIINWIMREDQK